MKGYGKEVWPISLHYENKKRELNLCRTGSNPRYDPESNSLLCVQNYKIKRYFQQSSRFIYREHHIDVMKRSSVKPIVNSEL